MSPSTPGLRLWRWLNEHGQRTRTGRLWSQVTVFDVLRNPFHAGRIGFGGVSYEAQHTPIVDGLTFEEAQRTLEARKDTAWRRRSNTSDYLLSGLVHCAKCGNRYLGTVAHGRRGPYRYYTCFSRNRYGRQGCQADRADALERAVLGSLQATYANTDLIANAGKEARRRAEAATRGIRSELRSIDARIAKTEQALDRYYEAFESGHWAAAASQLGRRPWSSSLRICARSERSAKSGWSASPWLRQEPIYSST